MIDPAPLTLAVVGKTCRLGGYPLFTGHIDKLLNRLGALRGAGGVHLVITVNVDQILAMERDAAAFEALHGASIRTIDGAPVQLLARALGDRNASRITGADLINDVTTAAKCRAWTIAILGGAPGTAERAAATLRRSSGWDRIHAVPVPLLADVSDTASLTPINQLRAIGPDVVFVCMGAPKQESWVLRWREELPDAVYVGAGAAVDFAAGDKARAPSIVQRLGGEWLWRLAQEPRRLAHRYLVRGPGFARVILRSIGPGK